jgi:hypothetical protein
VLRKPKNRQQAVTSGIGMTCADYEKERLLAKKAQTD